MSLKLKINKNVIKSTHNSRLTTHNYLLRVYKKLYQYFGPQYWWPAQTQLEVVVGALLTQNTSWSNVEKAIINLKKEKVLTLEKLLSLDIVKLADLIKSAGYFNVKAKRLKNLLVFIKDVYGGDFKKMQKKYTLQLRQELLGVNGVGPETADSILLYALNKPIFVIDAYTKRIFQRLKIYETDVSYDDAQKLFMDSLKPDTKVFNEYHALIVKLAKDYCKNKNPGCSNCPLAGECD